LNDGLSRDDHGLGEYIRSLYRKIKRFLRRIRDALRGTKNPWNDIETSARLYGLWLKQRAGRNTNGLRNDLISRLRENPPQDFSQVVRLVQLITEKPVVVTPIRCLHCGANLRLPSSGHYVECTHCGYDYHITNVLEMLEKLI